MKKTTSSLKKAMPLKREDLKNIIGGNGGEEMLLCGCDCGGRVTGPKYCESYISCPQIYTCDDPVLLE